MSIPQPLGVRIYSPALSFDQYVTAMVQDLSFRSTAPGGMASATLKIQRNASINAPDMIDWNLNTSAVSPDNQSFVVDNSVARNISPGDRFWVYDNAGNIKFGGDRFTVTGRTSNSTPLNSNSGFESGASGWSPIGGTLTTVPTTRLFATGMMAKMVPDGVTATVRVDSTPLVPVTSGTTYTASGWLYCDVSRDVALNINWYDASSNYLSTSVNNVTVQSRTWTYFTADFSAPSSGFANIIPTMSGTPATSHVLYLDDIILSTGGKSRITYSPATSAPIANGDNVLCKVPNPFFNGSLIGFNKWILMFNRIQIVDLRTMEIVWEGRIEDPARETDKNTWTIGALGNMAFASDINMPVAYLDARPSSWSQWDGLYAWSDFTTDDASGTIKISGQVGLSIPGQTPPAFDQSGTFAQGHITNQSLARIDGIFTGADTSSASGYLAIRLTLQDLTPIMTNKLTSSKVIFGYNIGTFFPDGIKEFDFQFGSVATAGQPTVTVKDGSFGQIRMPRVQFTRMDRWRTVLNTAASYPDNGLRVAQIVEDVIGRMFNGGHSSSGADIPFRGHISPYTAFVDQSSNVLMLDEWTFYDGTTAQNILNKICEEAQPTAYWAIWESKFGATDSDFDAKARFEFVNWPNSWGYLISSQDGLQEQPDGSGEYNYLFYNYQNSANDFAPFDQMLYLQEYWNSGLTSDLNYSWISRSQTLKRGSGPTSSNTAFNESANWVTDNSRNTNSGSVTVKRPVLCYDPGNNSYSGIARRLDPWMLRPGRVARIYDLLPRAMMNSMPYGSTIPNRILDDCIFRVTAVEWSSSDNAAKLDLDEIASWDISRQIVVRGGKVQSQVVYR